MYTARIPSAKKNLLFLIAVQFILVVYVLIPVYISPIVYQGVGSTGFERHLGINGTEIPWLSSPLLPRAFDRQEHDQFITLLDNMDRFLTDHGIRYVIFYGALLGSYVMHGLIPWDSDVDVVVRLADLGELTRIIGEVEEMEKYGLSAFWHDTPRTRSLKLCFRQGGQDTGVRPWSWPFIDLQFYGENDTHVWNTDPPGSGYMVFPREVFYPLQRRPLSSLWLPAPRKTRTILRAKYGDTFRCMRGAWNHKKEIPYWSLLYTPCHALLPIYPFVERHVKGDKVEETLRLDGRKLYTIRLNAHEEYGGSDCKFCI